MSVREAAQRTGYSDKTIRRWCESGHLPAIPKPYGKKITYLISPQALEMLAAQELEKEEQKKIQTISLKMHSEHLAKWKTATTKGLINGKVFSNRTIETYEFYVNGFFKQYRELSPETLQTALMKIPPKNFAKRLKVYEALLCLGKFLVREGVLLEENVQQMIAFRPKRHIPPKRFTVNEQELNKLLGVCNDALDRLIIILLSHTGLRAFEACSLQLQDIDLEKAFLTVQCGKGGKRRMVGLAPIVIEAIGLYLGQDKHRPNRFLLLNSQGKQMDRHGLYHRIEKIGNDAKVKVSPHALRRAFVTINANKGRSLVMLQMACGHSDITTTRNYCLTAEQEVIEAMKGWD